MAVKVGNFGQLLPFDQAVGLDQRVFTITATIYYMRIVQRSPNYEHGSH